MRTHNINVTVCLDQRPSEREYEQIVAGLRGVSGVRGVTLNRRVTRLLHVDYDPRATRAGAIPDRIGTPLSGGVLVRHAINPITQTK